MKKWIPGVIGAMMIMLLYPVFTASAAEPLKVFYFERPPYYYTADHKARGILVDRTRQVMKDAGIRAVYLPMPPKRILYTIKNDSMKACSIGWFKTPERKRFARFSIPIYQNLPLILLTRKNMATQIASAGSKPVSLEHVFDSKTLVMGRVNGFSYGSYVDRMMLAHPRLRFERAQNQKDLIRMLVSGRISYLLLAPEEVDTLVRQMGLPFKLFDVIRLSDLPRGNRRYLMFDKAVDQDTIDRINRAIEKQAWAESHQSGK